MTKRYIIEGVSRKTGKGYVMGECHNEATADELVAYGNREIRPGRSRPIFWYIVDQGDHHV